MFTPPKKSRQDETIKEFCLRLAQIEGHGVRVLEYPDQVNSGKGGCDAIIERGERHFALEHTTIDSYLGQRLDDARFRKFILFPLETAVRSKFRDSWVEIVVPASALSHGADWQEITASLQKSCLDAVGSMPFSDDCSQFQFLGVPFPVAITRHEDRDAPDCYVLRQEPKDLEDQLRADMERAIRDKANQLTPYRKDGLPTILILDYDNALVNRRSLADAFAKAAKSQDCSGLDEVFIAEASHNPIWFFPVKLGGRIYPLPEFERFRKLQYAITYGKPLDDFAES